MTRTARLLAALLLLAGGAVHLQLWRGGYRSLPYVGPMFLANVIGSGALALALVVRRDLWIAAAGALLAVGSLVALVMSRTVGIAGFMEPGYSVAALRTIAAETGALVALGSVAVSTFDRRRAALVPVRAR